MVYRDKLDIDIKYDKKSLDNYKKVIPSDFVISLRSFQGGFEMSDKLGITSPAYTIFNFKNTNDHYPLFWKFLFKRYDFIESLKRVTFGIRDGKAISFQQFGDTKPIFPKIEEQKRIAELLFKLDTAITLHEDKQRLLEQLKTALLQKLFPQGDAKTPELRFAGFNDDWEQRKLGEIFSERKEKSQTGDEPLLSVTINNGVIKSDSIDRKNNASKDKSNYKAVYPNDIAYNSMRMWQGALGVSVFHGIVSPAYTVVSLEDNNEVPYFYSYDFKRSELLYSFRTHSQGLTSDTWNLKYPLFKTIKVWTTTPGEQSKIADILRKLDTTIALHGQKIAQLKQLKQALLQKMFV